MAILFALDSCVEFYSRLSMNFSFQLISFVLMYSVYINFVVVKVSLNGF